MVKKMKNQNIRNNENTEITREQVERFLDNLAWI